MTSSLSGFVAHAPETALYFTQAGTYAMAFWAARRGKHAPGYTYFASCLIHVTLGLLFLLPLA